MCLPHTIISTLATLGKRVEREKVYQRARERRVQKCAFLKCPSLCLHHLFWHLCWLFSLPTCSPLPCISLVLCIWLTYFTLALLLLHTCNSIYTLSLHLLGIYFHCKLWLFHKYNSTLDFSSSSLHLPLENSMPHGLSFSLTLPPRMGAFPPCFLLERSFFLPLVETWFPLLHYW